MSAIYFDISSWFVGYIFKLCFLVDVMKILSLCFNCILSFLPFSNYIFSLGWTIYFVCQILPLCGFHFYFFCCLWCLGTSSRFVRKLERSWGLGPMLVQWTLWFSKIILPSLGSLEGTLCLHNKGKLWYRIRKTRLFARNDVKNTSLPHNTLCYLKKDHSKFNLKKTNKKNRKAVLLPKARILSQYYMNQ